MDVETQREGPVLRPSAAEELGPLVRAAAEGGYGLVPRSSTRRPRTGRAVAGEGTYLVDLSGLKRILRVDRRERVVVFEAGVTFRELDAAVAAEGLRLCHPLLPPPGKSAVAALLDREPPLVPKYHWDTTDPMLCAEVYFGTGDRFRTGGAAGPGATLEEQWAAGMAQKNPLGPAQTDLAKIVQGAQGTMGIATWVSAKLELLPELRKSFVVQADSYTAVAGFVSGLTRRRLGDEVVLFDRAQVLHLATALGVAPGGIHAPWCCLVRFGSLPNAPQRSLAYQEEEAHELAAASGLHLEEAPDEFVAAVLGLGPADEYWKRLPSGGFTEAYFLTSLDRAGALVDVARRHWAAAGVPPGSVGAYVQPTLQGRSCHVEVSASVSPAEAAALDAGLPSLAAELLAAGAYFSRPHGPFLEAAYASQPDAVAALKVVKTVLDPAGALNPGALCFAQEES